MELKVPSQYFKDASVERLKIKYHFILLSSANIFILIKLVDQSMTKNVGSGGFLLHAEVAVLGVVRLHHCCGHLGRGVDGELKLDLLPVVNTPPLHEEGGESGTNSSTKGVEDEETLKAGALVCQLPDPVKHQVDDLLADGVVAPGVVVGGVLLPCHQLLRVKHLPVDAAANLAKYFSD